MPPQKIMIISRNINGIDFAVNPHKSVSLLCEEHIANLTQGMMTQNRNRARMKKYMEEECSKNMRLFLENQKS